MGVVYGGAGEGRPRSTLTLPFYTAAIPLTFRPALPEEAERLSHLAFAAKAHWGYSAELMDACREDLTLSENCVREGLTTVGKPDGRIVGFYRLANIPEGPSLNDLFVSPESIGAGVGQALWQHAAGLARSLGWPFVLLDSDPHAEGFSRKMGASKGGEVPSAVFPGRRLPRMRFDLT